MNGAFRYALSPKMHNPGANMPCSSFWKSNIPSNARQSDVDPGYTIDMSRIRPRASQTAWQFNPNFFFLAQWNFPELHPALSQSFGDGLCIQIRIPSMAPAQHSNPALETSAKPRAIDRCMSWLSGYSIVKLGCRLMASTTYQQLFIVSVWPIPYVVIISYRDPPANHRMAHARRTSGKIGPFGMYRVVPFFPDAAMIYGRSTEARRTKVLYFIRYALRKYTFPSCL